MAPKSNAWKYVKNEWLGDFPTAASSVGLVVGYIGLALSITKLVREVTHSWPGQTEFAVYIFATYILTVGGFAIAAALLRRLWAELKEAREQRALFAEIHHLTAEIVRQHTSDVVRGAKLKSAQDDMRLHELMRRVVSYVTAQTGHSDITVAIKYLATTASAGTQIDAVFRDSPVAATWERANKINADESVVYMHFAEGTRQIKRVLIRDTNCLDTDADAGSVKAKRNAAYQAYATLCHFRSVLAFPLRQPVPEGEMSVSGILGFLSFDCPEPNAFDGLFHVDSGAAKTNDGRHLRDTPDLQMFFGLADSVATLAVLARSETASKA